VERILVATGIERLKRGSPRDAPQAHAMTSLLGILGEEEALDEIAMQAGEAQTLGARPLVVLTAGVDGLPPDVSEETRAAFGAAKLAMQQELAALSTNSDHRVVHDARHYIQFDDPAAVIAAIEDLVAAVRTGASVQTIAATRSDE
jgi:pimeloyl-ACP methyl ester carboxylesterase